MFHQQRRNKSPKLAQSARKSTKLPSTTNPSQQHASSTPASSPISIPSRNVNMYKYGKSKVNVPKTPQERHTNANRSKRADAKKAQYQYALEHYESQKQNGIQDPELLPVKMRTPAQERRLAIRQAMRDAFENGDLTHIPLMVNFLKKMHNPVLRSKLNNGLHDVFNDGDYDTLQRQQEQDPDHLRLIQADLSALQNFGLLSNPQKQPEQQPIGSNPALDKLVYGYDSEGLQQYQSLGQSIDASAPNLRNPPKYTLDSDGEAIAIDPSAVSSATIASKLPTNPHAQMQHLHQKNPLINALLTPALEAIGQPHMLNPSSSTLQQIAQNSNQLHQQKEKVSNTATPIAGYSQFTGINSKQFGQLKPATHSISGDVISSISLGNDEFSSLAGSPTFRLNPQNLAVPGKAKNSINADGTVNETFIRNEDIDDDDEVQASRDHDAALAMDGHGQLGLKQSSLQKHANEFASDSLIPTLGFLRQYYTNPQAKREVNDVNDVEGLTNQGFVDGIGGLQRTEGHFTNPRQNAVISGRRSRAIETIARTSAAVLAKKQLLAHNSNILHAINPSLLENHSHTKETRDIHYVDLYSLGYQISRIELSRDLSTCTILWTAPCLYSLPESQNTMELERPLLDVVTETLHGETAKQGRIELQPINEAMRHISSSNTHNERRARYDIGADLLQDYQFTGDYHNYDQQANKNRLNNLEATTGGQTEVFFDKKKNVAVRKNPDGTMEVLSQGDPKLWQLRPMFQKGSYIPGTLDVLPPQLRKNSQIMTEQQRQTKQHEVEIRRRAEFASIRAGVEGRPDPRTVNQSGHLDDSFLTPQIKLPSTYDEHKGREPMTIAQQTLETMIHTDSPGQSTLSLNTFAKCSQIVSSGTNHYLNSMVPSIRWAIGKALNTKYVPQLKFEFDSSYGDAKNRALSISAVLQRQFTKQIDKVKYDEDDRSILSTLPTSDPISPTISPIEAIEQNRSRIKQQENHIDLIMEKQKLLNKGKISDVLTIDEYLQSELREQQSIKQRQYQNIEHGDNDDVSFQDEQQMKAQQILQDNISKLLASAEALKTGKQNSIATSTRLKYHELSKADKILLVSRYLEIDLARAEQLSDERIDVALAMLRREMGAHQRKKERQEFKLRRRADGVSKDQIDRELISFDKRQQDEMKDDTDYEEGVARWEFGVDSDAERPNVGTFLVEKSDDDVYDANVDTTGRRTKSSADLKTKSSNSGANYTPGDFDQEIAAAFFKHGTQHKKANKKSTITIQSSNSQGGPTIEMQGGDVAFNPDDLMKFREQYLYGDSSPPIAPTAQTTQTHPVLKKTNAIEQMGNDDDEQSESGSSSDSSSYTDSSTTTTETTTTDSGSTTTTDSDSTTTTDGDSTTTTDSDSTTTTDSDSTTTTDSDSTTTTDSGSSTATTTTDSGSYSDNSHSTGQDSDEYLDFSSESEELPAKLTKAIKPAPKQISPKPLSGQQATSPTSKNLSAESEFSTEVSSYESSSEEPDANFGKFLAPPNATPQQRRLVADKNRVFHESLAGKNTPRRM